MKPVVKKGLIIIGVLYAVTVAVTVTNFVKQAEPVKPELVTQEIQESLNAVRERAYARDPDHIRPDEVTQKEAAQLLHLLARRGKIININYTLIMQCFNFAILLLLLYGIAWEPLLEFLDRRRQHVQSQLDEAAQRKSDAEALQDQRQEELGQLREERGDIIEKARTTAEQQRDEIIQRAQREAERIVEQTRERLHEEFRSARTTLREEVADLTIRIATRLLQREMAGEDHDRFIKETLERMALDPQEEPTGE